MRIQVKGGVWKNTEDEILKAAVMKYGKNQWARISSLLTRKSAKQCKARWNEWLDPSIKKTEWSREEEEKLLHLAKIMPNQWKTIAPLVGRTASQCLEHYEKLLDAAQEKDENYDPAEDPRRLRPGEIDPNPEAKPARPDPVDMDEDEKEMLSEARARLANTKGKKAKRKAREKQLEEARRLASLQKRRELKAAGIDIPNPKKKIKGIDYNREIPFQKKPAPGFYEVDWEAATPKPAFKPMSLEALEGKRRRDEEVEERKRDAKKQKLKEKKDLPSAIMQINKLNEPESVLQRSKLILPAPQLDDGSLEELAKINSEAANALMEEEGSQVTKSLLPSYNATPTPVRPLRTPLPVRTPSREDTLKKEVQNLIALTEAQTPLAGGQNPVLHPTDFSGVTPKPQEIKTPNVLATPLLARGGQTPRRAQDTPQRTPIRDVLSINEGKEEQLQSNYQAMAQRKSLQEALQSLPAPQNEYKIMLPELPEPEQEEIQEQVEADAMELLQKQQKLEQERQAKKLRMRSQVLQRELPRPVKISTEFPRVKSNESDPLKYAADLIQEEMARLILYEAMEYPFKEAQLPTEVPQLHFEQFEEEELEHARQLLQAEVKALQAEAFPNGLDLEEIARIYDHAINGNKKENVESLSKELDYLKGLMAREAARASKLEQRQNIYNGGYYNRANALIRQIQDLHYQIDQSTIELECFSKLWELEKQAIPQRIETLKQEVREQEMREAELQQRYLSLQSAQ